MRQTAIDYASALALEHNPFVFIYKNFLLITYAFHY